MFRTQSSSRRRVKEEVYDEEMLEELYRNFDRMGDREFKDYCIELISLGTGKQAKKDEIMGLVEESSSKAKALKLTNDFIFAGQGLGV